MPLDRVRYVRVRTGQGESVRSAVDVITSDENISWRFPEGTDDRHVEALAAVLAESMVIPDEEREALTIRGDTLIKTNEEGEGPGMAASGQAGSDSTNRRSG